jgi:hypothetical protein
MASAYGPFTMNKTALGRESTFGTGVAASTLWRGPFSMVEDASEVVTVDENVGLLVQAERTYFTKHQGRLAMPSTELTFEQVGHILEAGVKTVTPTGTNPYTRAYAYPTDNTVPTPKSYTIETYNNLADVDALEMNGCLVEEFTFEGNAREAWKMSATWFGRRPATTTPTSLSTLVTVEEALIPKTLLYIDASGGTVGTTQKSGVFMGAQIKVKTGLIPLPVGDGNLYHPTYKWTKPEITFTVTLELEKDGAASMVATERAAHLARSVRLFKTNCTGSGSKAFTMTWAGVYDSVGDYQNDNGNTSVQLSGHAVYSSADTLFWSCSVVNTVATLP